MLTKVLFWIFEILSFRFLTNFWISPLHPMGKPKTSIIWKTSDCRAKQSEIWASGVSIQSTQGTFDTSVVKVILGSFGVLQIFKNFVSRKRQFLEWKIHLDLCVIQFMWSLSCILSSRAPSPWASCVYHTVDKVDSHLGLILKTSEIELRLRNPSKCPKTSGL